MSMKFIKIKDPENRFDQTDIEFSVNHECLPDILEAFGCFLRGCGFTINGELEVVKDEIVDMEEDSEMLPESGDDNG